MNRNLGTKNKIQPMKIVKVYCPNCGELMLKVYPWSSIGVTPGKQIPNCSKCINKASIPVP